MPSRSTIAIKELYFYCQEDYANHLSSDDLKELFLRHLQELSFLSDPNPIMSALLKEMFDKFLAGNPVDYMAQWKTDSEVCVNSVSDGDEYNINAVFEYHDVTCERKMFLHLDIMYLQP
jgi:hypothetical protein